MILCGVTEDGFIEFFKNHKLNNLEEFELVSMGN